MDRTTVHNVIERYVEQRIQEAVASLLMSQLARCFGQLDGARKAIISGLSVTELEQLGEDLLTFRYLTDLDEWFHSQFQKAL